MGTSQSALNGSSRETMPGAWNSCASTDDEPELDDKDDTQSESEASDFELTSLALYSEATLSDKDKPDDMGHEKDETKGSVESTFGEDISGLLAMGTKPNSYVGPVTALREHKEKEPRKAITLAEQVEDVREAFGVPVIPFKDSDIRLHHPNHPYNFYNKNLRCVKCDGNCQICQASCCKYKYFEVRANDTTILRSASDEIDPEDALDRIKFWQPTGTDLPTFLMCSTCRRLVCPRCCGICPDRVVCADIQCIECKPEPWELCDWHIDL